MPFARFMELALYHPEWGYYSRVDAPERVGKAGDFFTSVSVGPLFGRLLAIQFTRWWNRAKRPAFFHLVECGGLDGQLARDILSTLRTISPDCFEASRYYLVEPLPRLAERQRKTLLTFPSVKWMTSLDAQSDEAPLRNGIEGVIFGNELLDAFPVHRLEKVGDRWMECCVALEGDALTCTHQPAPASWTETLPPKANGQAEYSPRAIAWLRDAASILHRGRILLLDYGWTDEEYFQVERPRGTVRAFRRHRTAEDELAQPGEQDLTSHVRWTPLIEEAGRLGLGVEEFIQQGRWLTRILAEEPFDMTPAEIHQFQTLTHPEMMGAPFRALVLKKE
jgi:SAM-dependent MidA family methyltransferase